MSSAACSVLCQMCNCEPGVRAAVHVQRCHLAAWWLPVSKLSVLPCCTSGTLFSAGRGSKAHLLHNLERSGIPENSLTLLPGNSMLLSAQNFTSRGYPAFRFLSVDGGHTLEITLHDMMVASCLVRDGGIVVLDDFPNPSWMGVAEALMHFVHAQDRLVPFMHGANKVWFTTPGHVHFYQELMASNPSVFPCTKDHVSKQTLAGHKLCWTGYN